ncbi:hypothetical protein [Sphingopyxis macrogoltabida]|uniref:hypothetical protein n=1 Tax=Sphingopyxis macrogoltabida TaxID=33050 RepID=UPI0006ED09DB|nr:hypothetical protein [Sphingopyxis macrogoltabida]ALJ14088.1 thiol-disulfide isomerase and thioredoxin [Sphingopyxis macrogoltabida]
MTRELKLCDHCWRAVETVVIGRDKIPGGVEVPKPHADRDGEQCTGIEAEVIVGWDIPS